MNPHFERAQLLYQQGRYEQAEESLRRSLTDEPDFALAHAFLALCMVERKAWKDATDESERAIGLAPDNPFTHHVYARVMLERNLVDEAEKAAKQAVELDPYDADLHYTLGAVQMAQRRWPAALEQADEGLRLDAEHIQCANLRAMALVKLGRKGEADHVMKGVLSRDPDDAFSHANQGWTALNQSDPKKALEHFREALRLDPTLEYAQAGMIEAMKARYLIYRLMLRWFLWMSQLGTKWQWGIILALYFGTRAIGNAAATNPDLAPVLWTIWGLLIAFGVMTWLATPLSNLLMLLNRYGKHILTRDQKLGAICVGLCLLLSLSILAYSFVAPDRLSRALGIRFAIVSGLYVIVMAALFQVPTGRPRWAMAAAAAGLAAIAIYGFWQMYSALDLPPAIALPMIKDGAATLDKYYPGVLIFNIVSNVLAVARFERR
jgi:tetratricopeptide (TPR) repeat protein